MSDFCCEQLVFTRLCVVILILLFGGYVLYTYTTTRSSSTTERITHIHHKSQPVIPDYQNILINDEQRAYNPLVEPYRRPSLDAIPPEAIRRYFNIPTRYYNDSPSVMGVLTKDGNINQTLQLFGFKDPINNYKYNYYTMNNNGIKLDVKPERNVMELNDGDHVNVLNEKYTVKMYANDFYKYNPSVF